MQKNDEWHFNDLLITHSYVKLSLLQRKYSLDLWKINSFTDVWDQSEFWGMPHKRTPADMLNTANACNVSVVSGC